MEQVRARRAALAWVMRLTVAACSCLAPATAFAAAPSASDAEHALSLFRQSTTAYNEGRFQDAIDLLSQAYALAKQPVLLFNLARAYEGLGDLPKAIEAYKSYLSSDPNATDHGSIEQRVETLQKQLDDRAALERQRDEERRNAEAARLVAEEARRREEEKTRPRPSVVPWIVAGTGVVGLGTGVVLGLLSRSQYQAAKDEPYKDPAQAKYSTAQDEVLGANVAFVAGGVLTALGVVWGYLDVRSTRASARSGDTSAGPRISVGLGSIALHQSF